MILGNNSLIEVAEELTEFKEHHRRDGFQQGKEMAMAAIGNYAEEFGIKPQTPDQAEWNEGYIEGLRAARKIVEKLA